MAITKLLTNFVDDIINTSVNAHRKYRMTAVSGETDTYTLEDTTTYIQRGTDYDADVVNNTNATVNQVIDLAEGNADDMAGFLDGSVEIKKATTADTAENAQTAGSATTAGSSDNDFILCNQYPLTFANGFCQLNDTRITANSVADVYFTTATIATAEQADITVECYANNVKLFNANEVTGSIVATIRIRVVA